MSEIDLTETARRIEAVSLLGEPLFSPEIEDAETQLRLERNLEEARLVFEAHPTDETAIIWYGRRLAYVGRYTDALNTFTYGLHHHPKSYRVRRHSGHRLITLRRIDEAIIDLSRAAELARNQPDEIEPDGAPNAAGIPRSTTKSNIWYHLGLAHYLKGDFENARSVYQECLTFSTNDDMLCATTHWLYMTLRRLGRDAEAARTLEPIHPGMEILENRAYHSLLLMYRGERSPEDVLGEAQQSDLDFATVGYGVANWWWCRGDRDRAAALWQRVVRETQWPAFGHIAAEAELARLRKEQEPS